MKERQIYALLWLVDRAERQAEAAWSTFAATEVGLYQDSAQQMSHLFDILADIRRLMYELQGGAD